MFVEVCFVDAADCPLSRAFEPASYALSAGNDYGPVLVSVFLVEYEGGPVDRSVSR